MKRVLTVILIVLSNIGYSQVVDTVWFNRKWDKTDRANGYYFRTIERDTINHLFLIKDHNSTGKLQMEGTLISRNPEVKDGEFNWYYPDGNKKMKCLYEKGRLIRLVEWYENGERKPIPASSIRVGAGDNLPEFPGGDEKLKAYLNKKMRYPSDAYDKNITGKVNVFFTVTENGEITNVHVKDTVFPSLDKEAIRVIKSMPRWKPGVQNGEPVSIYVVMLIIFKK